MPCNSKLNDAVHKLAFPTALTQLFFFKCE